MIDLDAIEARAKHGAWTPPDTSALIAEVRRLRAECRDKAVVHFLDNISAEQLHKDLDGAFSEYNQGNLPELAFINTIITTMFNQLPEHGGAAPLEAELGEKP